MKIKILFLLLTGFVVVKAGPVITADKKYIPPSDWTTNREFQKVPWWSAFYSMERPEEFKFSEWKTHYPASLLKAAGITEDKFPTLVAKAIEDRKLSPHETKIYRVVSISDGSKEYVAIVQCVRTSTDPKQSDTHAISFFKKEADVWVVGEFSQDISKDPIAKLFAED